MLGRKQFCELVQQPPKPTLDHIAFLERRYEREVRRQQELDDLHTQCEEKWVAKKATAKEDNEERRRVRRRRKDERNRAVEDKAVEEREKQQERSEVKMEKVMGLMQVAGVRRGEHIHDAAMKTRSKQDAMSRGVWSNKAIDFDNSCTRIEGLVEKHHGFPQRRPYPSCYPPLNSTFATTRSHSPMTPRPPPSAASPKPPAAPVHSSPAATLVAASSGRGCITRQAVRAALDWIRFKNSAPQAELTTDFRI